MPGYPWSDGQFLLAADLNAEFLSLLNSVSTLETTRVNKSGDAMTGPLADTATAAVDNLGMHDLGSFMLNGASSLTEFQWSHPGNTSTEALAAGIVVPNGATGYTANAFGAYVKNDSTLAAGASAAYFYGRNTVVGATTFALNMLVTDQTNVGSAGVQSTVVGAEWDIGAFNINSHAIGSNMIGVFPNGTPALAVAYQAAVLNSPWQVAFESGDGAASVFGLSLGATGTSANSDGQPIGLSCRDGSNVSRLAFIQAAHAASGANLLLSASTGSLIAGTSAGALISTTTTNLWAFSSGSTPVGSITTNGTTTTYNTTSDYRLKVTYGAADGALIDRIKVYDAEFKAHPGQRYPMVLAHELQEVAPWCVTGEQDAVDEAGAIVPQQVGLMELVPALIAKVQALEARLAAVEAR